MTKRDDGRVHPGSHGDINDFIATCKRVAARADTPWSVASYTYTNL